MDLLLEFCIAGQNPTQQLSGGDYWSIYGNVIISNEILIRITLYNLNKVIIQSFFFFGFCGAFFFSFFNFSFRLRAVQFDRITEAMLI